MLPSLSYSHERDMHERGFFCTAGVDEVGAGALAGDVYAAAVVLRIGTRLKGVQDSKRMTHSAREHWSEVIKDRAQAWAIGSASVEEIVQLNIRQASFLAMRRALVQLSGVDAVLCDGFMIPGVRVHCKRVVGGDARVKSIAAASIIAKVARDAYMCEMSVRFPQYGFERHKGYGTAAHRRMIAEHGACELHRTTFLRNIKNY